MKIDLVASGLFDSKQFQAWSTEKQKAINAATARGMNSGGKEIRDAVRSQMSRAFKIKRKGFLSSMSIKVFDKKKNQPPALWIGSKIPWLGIHEKGGTINGNMLIPLLPKRISTKKFQSLVKGLLAQGNAFFLKKRNGQTLLMAEYIRENSQELSRFRRAKRERSGKKMKRGEQVPIALLVKSITLKKRFDMLGTVQRSIMKLANAIEKELN